MGAKFTPEDLFRIAEDNMSEGDAFRFRFICETATFTRVVSAVTGQEVNVTRDERNLLEKIIRKIGIKGGVLRGAR